MADRRATHALDDEKGGLDDMVTAGARGEHRDREVALLIDAALELSRLTLNLIPIPKRRPGVKPLWRPYTEEAHVQWGFRHGRTTKRKPATELKAGEPGSGKPLKGSGKTAPRKGRLHHRRPHVASKKT